VENWQMLGRHRQTVGKSLLAAAIGKQTIGKCFAVKGKPLANAWPSQANRWQRLGRHRQPVKMIGSHKQTVGNILGPAWPPQANCWQMPGFHVHTIAKCLAPLGKPLANAWPSQQANCWQTLAQLLPNPLQII
jgi:hypothetical protein